MGGPLVGCVQGSVLRLCTLAGDQQMYGFSSAEALLYERHCFADVSAVAPRNAGSSLLTKPARVEQIVRSVSSVLSCPLTIKVGYLLSNQLPLH